MSLLSKCTLGLALFAFGCGSDNEFKAYPPFERTEDAKVWLTTGSALSVYANAYELLGVADGELTYGDPACPVTSDDGTTLTVEGGCTDANQREWTGRATVVRDGDDRTVEFANFEGAYGTVHRRRVSLLEHEFDAVLNLGGVTHIDYEGSIAGEYDARVVFNGSGRIERDGYLAPNGAVNASTVDEVIDDTVCQGQPVSGSTTVTARGDSATLTYDGETDCDDAKNARLSVNGEDRGLVPDIYCSVPAAGAKGSAGRMVSALVVFGLISSLAFRRGRRRRDRWASFASRARIRVILTSYGNGAGALECDRAADGDVRRGERSRVVSQPRGDGRGARLGMRRSERGSG